MSRHHCNEFAAAVKWISRSVHMRKANNRLPTLLVIASFILSGCGARQCLHTTMGCETESSGTEKPRREFGGPATACHPTESGAHFVD
jgi:hypothetical protein